MKFASTMALTAALLTAVPARAEVVTRTEHFKQDNQDLQWFIAYDDTAKAKRPGVLVVHEWWGHNKHAENQAVRLAKAGYVALALDMYGEGKLATHPKDAAAFMGVVMKDQKLMATRFEAALEALKKDPHVDPAKIAAIGYCFGGTVALTMARAGKDLAAVGTFHAGLKPAGPPASKGSVKARILVQTGGADPNIPKEQIEAFEKEMKDADARCEVVVYPEARHSFTNPDADKAGMEALKYDADVDAKSFAKLLAFFGEVFGK